MKEIISLLGDRDFKTHNYLDDIYETSFPKLTDGIMDFINEYSLSQIVN